MDVDLRACACYFRPVLVAVRLWTSIHVLVLALFRVFALCTWVHASGRVSTYLYRPFSGCSLCARGYKPQDIDARAFTPPFRSLSPGQVGVLLWTRIHVPVPALFVVNALCTWVYATGR